jgi:hypothetical protein
VRVGCVIRPDTQPKARPTVRIARPRSDHVSTALMRSRDRVAQGPSGPAGADVLEKVLAPHHTRLVE